MVLTGGALIATLVFLALWLALMFTVSLRSLRALAKETHTARRAWVAMAGLGLATLAVASLFLLHLSWISANISQQLGAKAVGILGSVLFWSSVVGFILSLFGAGKLRFFGVVTCLITGLWLETILVTSAISMGPTLVRHPVRTLIPDGYVGWVKVNYGVKGAQPLTIENGVIICKIPESDLLETSSQLEVGWANDEYFYYSPNGSTRPLRETGWGSGGLIWGDAVGYQAQPDGSKPAEFNKVFYVGTEEQYNHGVSSKRPAIQ